MSRVDGHCDDEVRLTTRPIMGIVEQIDGLEPAGWHEQVCDTQAINLSSPLPSELVITMSWMQNCGMSSQGT